MTQFPRLFSPVDINRRQLANRIVSSAHAAGKDQDGVLTDDLIRYHERKAQGGAGLIMTFGSAGVYQPSTAAYGHVNLWDQRNDEPLADLASRVHAYDALIMSQATHMGHRASSRATSGRPTQAPSGVPDEIHHEIPHALEIDEIQAIVRAFADVARRLEACGWDGIEITSFGDHLIEQFWSPVTNRRDDRYGGNFANRLRFSTEVIEAVGKAVSDDFIVAFRLTGDPLTDLNGLDAETMLRIAGELDAIGRIDLFNISGGTGLTPNAQTGVVPYDAYERGCFNHLARDMRQVVSKPVIAAGRILDPSQAEQALTNGDCDMVAMTRAIIADPDLPNRAKENEVERIRPCIAINEGCIGRLYAGMPIACSVNPAIEDDRLENMSPASQPRHVVVVGGGPAGMEAARVAAERGHQVSLFEAHSELGGQVLATAQIPDRPHYARHIEWLQRELGRLRVSVRLSYQPEADDVLAVEPGVVVLATGAASVCPANLIGDDARCITDIDILNDPAMVRGERVLVYDVEGQLRGAGAALCAANHNAELVELATPMFMVCENIDLMERPLLYRRMAQSGVHRSPGQRMVRSDKGELVLRDEWSDEERSLDDFQRLVCAGYRVADTTLKEELRQRLSTLEIVEVGDRLAPRRLRDAVAEGVNAGQNL